MNRIINHVEKSNILAIVGFVLSVYVNNAIPFCTMPNFQLGMWIAGFAQDLANGSILNIYAYYIGNPAPATLAFGLPGAWVTSLFIRIGIHAWDAYTMTVFCFIFIAYIFGYLFARYFEVSKSVAWLMSTVWITSPIVCEHQRYSMLAISLMFLVVYMYVFFRMVGYKKESINKIWYIIYVCICIGALFMDGYGFMMFSISSSICAVWVLYKEKSNKVFSIIFHVVSLMIAYFCYVAFIGKWEYAGKTIQKYCGWGADVSFWLLPTKGLYYLADMINFSVNRTNSMFWGDGSVWLTTFCLFFIIGATYAFLRVKNSFKYVVLCLALFSFWLAMGPTLKCFTVKDESQINSQVMEIEQGIIPTGNACVYRNIPGIKTMGACYRWTALGIFSCWMMMVLLLSRHEKKIDRRVTVIIALITLLFNMPNLEDKYKAGISYREMAIAFEEKFVMPLGDLLNKEERVAFLPVHNDIFVVYTAPRLKIRTYNIGGDKNLYMAREKWPDTMRAFSLDIRDYRNNQLQDDFAYRTIQLLVSNDVDAVVWHYVHPTNVDYSMRNNNPELFRGKFDEPKRELLQTGVVDIYDKSFFCVIRLKGEKNETINSNPVLQ